MSFRLSPGIYLFEEDRSQVISSEIQNTIAIVGAFKKGPIDPTRCSTRDELYNRYTTGAIDRKLGYSTYSAYNALENATNVVIKRVVNDALYSGASIIKNGPVQTETAPFLIGSSTDYSLGGKDTNAVSITGPLPMGAGLSMTMTNNLTDETVEILSSYSQTATSNEILQEYAEQIQKQLDLWGENGKAEVNKMWNGSSKQQIQSVALNRDLVQGESITLSISDLYSGIFSTTVEYTNTSEETFEALRIAINGSGFAFAYVDPVNKNTMILTALNAGPNRLTLSSSFVDVAEEKLTATITEIQQGRGIYDDNTIQIVNPDNVVITYNDLTALMLPIDDATIFSQVAIAIADGIILEGDRDTVMAEIEAMKPITTVEQCNQIIEDWANANPFMKSINLTTTGIDPMNPVEDDVLTVSATMSNDNPVDLNSVTINWTDEFEAQNYGTDSELLVEAIMVGLKLKVKVSGHRNNLEHLTNVVAEA